MTSRLAPIALALFAVAAPAVAQPARIAVVNVDGPGVGFNDPTPAAPVGGNPGTTRGQQALNVFQHAANRWAANLQSKQLIIIVATFTPLTCSPTGAVLGAAGPNWYFANVAPAEGGQSMEPDTWYPAALAEKRTRIDITADPLVVADPADAFEIFTLFNSQLGIGTCLTGNGWYFGLDNNQPSNRIDLLAVVMHEFGHGLGVTVGPTNTSTSGARPLGFPSVWERRMLDVTSGKRWIDMTNAERVASARNTGNLVWAGQFTTSVVPSVLDFQLSLRGPAIPTGEVLSSTLGPPLPRNFGGILVAPNDGAGTSLGCVAYPAGSQVAGTIVLVDRGVCTFVQKAQVAQAAGATGIIIANNIPGVFGIGVVDPTVTIPVLSTSPAYGASLRAAALPTAVSTYLDRVVRTGTTAGFPRLFAPNPFQSGSSVSHFDTSLTPSVLMEPSITSDLTTKVKNPFDLTLALLRDIGW